MVPGVDFRASVQLYLKMNEEVPEAMDYQLRRRALLNGDEWVNVFVDCFYVISEKLIYFHLLNVAFRKFFGDV